ncbi:hypothetical protein MTR67_002889 [Solanum verrucosum]|uniref:Uncharacterized protein n=1 Tax=Solanum verrucosum TaxID=315347 RepID=A0AAF0T978_SOLVR|nr:hypothetical protein MTR67_002889 [Solanum verrucosum]
MDLRSVSPFHQPGLIIYFSFQKIIFFEANNGTPVRTVDQYMVCRSLSVAPYLQFSKNQVLEPSQSHSTVQQYGS